MAERGAELFRLRQRDGQRAGLAGEADGMGRRRGKVAKEGEGQREIGRKVEEADAVGADNPQAGVARDRNQSLLKLDAVRLAGLGIARRIDQRSADPGLGAIENDGLDRLTRRR